MDNLNRLLIFTGAGISAESGLSTFRDTNGLWKKYNIDDVCNYHNFKKDKENHEKRAYMFNFYNDVKKAILKAEPNEAHYQVAKWQKQYGEDRVVIVTANIDNLFEKAGCKDVIHVHGEIFHMHCAACQSKWHIGNDEYQDIRCPHCSSSLTKPNIVFFYEDAPLYERMHYHFHPKRRQYNDLLLYVGSSMSVIHPLMLFGHSPKAKLGRTILVNKDVSDDDILFQHQYYGNATEMLPLVDKEIVQFMMDCY